MDSMEQFNNSNINCVLSLDGNYSLTISCPSFFEHAFAMMMIGEIFKINSVISGTEKGGLNSIIQILNSASKIWIRTLKP